MNTLKLVYFDNDFGRGEPARLALAVAGVPFTDDRVPVSDWGRRKTETPLHTLPVLEVDGRGLIQSNAINRYVGKLTGLYPNDPWQAALCDEVLDIAEDVQLRIGATFPLPDEVRKVRREALASGPIPRALARLGERLKAAGGRYFVEDRLTVADLRVVTLLRFLQSGRLDDIPADLPEKVAPVLAAHRAEIENHPAVKARYGEKGQFGS